MTGRQVFFKVVGVREDGEFCSVFTFADGMTIYRIGGKVVSSVEDTPLMVFDELERAKRFVEDNGQARQQFAILKVHADIWEGHVPKGVVLCAGLACKEDIYACWHNEKDIQSNRCDTAVWWPDGTVFCAAVYPLCVVSMAW